jgi:hypothetical protein
LLGGGGDNSTFLKNQHVDNVKQALDLGRSLEKPKQ